MTELTSVRWSGWLAVAAGAFVALVGVGTLAGMPWRYAGGGPAAAAIQVLGTLATVGVGAGLAWLGARRLRDGR